MKTQRKNSVVWVEIAGTQRNPCLLSKFLMLCGRTNHDISLFGGYLWNNLNGHRSALIFFRHNAELKGAKVLVGQRGARTILLEVWITIIKARCQSLI